LAPQDQLDQLDQKAHQVKQEVLVLRVPLDQKVHQEPVVPSDQVVILGPQDKMEQQDSQDQVEIEDQVDNQDHLDQQVPWDHSDHPDPQEPVELPVRREALEPQVILDHQDLWVNQDLRATVELLAARVPQDLLGTKGLRDRRAHLGRQDSRDPKVSLVIVELQDLKELLDLQVLAVRRDHKVQLVSQDQMGLWGPPVTVVSLVTPELQEPLVIRGRQGLLGQPALLVLLVQQANLALLEIWAPQVMPELKGHRAPRALRAIKELLEEQELRANLG